MRQVEMGVRDPVQVVTHDLLAEFDETLSHETISTLAVEEVRAFEDAEVREFVSVLAWRRARKRAWVLAWGGEPVDRSSSSDAGT
ncbi:MAG: three-helix bundle dimerization domain-containing protein [Actinomycetota bacterium]